MKKSMSQRRVPRKIGGDDEDEHMSSGSADTGPESTGECRLQQETLSPFLSPAILTSSPIL